MKRIDVTKEKLQMIELFDVPMLFTCLRCNKDSVPEGYFLYEVRHTDEDWGLPCEVAKGILVNFFGTIISKKEIEMPEGFLLSESEDWFYTDMNFYLKEWDEFSMFSGLALRVDTFRKKTRVLFFDYDDHSIISELTSSIKKLKIVSQFQRVDSLYTLTVCQFPTAFLDVIKESLEAYNKSMIILGHRDYQEFCEHEIYRLIIHRREKQENDNSEYDGLPK